MRGAAALSLSLSLLTGACFPNNATHRTIAKITEGGVAIGGVVLLAMVNSGADCMTAIPGMPDQECEDKAKLLGGIGLGMVLTGLIGFIVTVSTAPDDPPEPTAAVAPTPIETTPPAPPTAPPTTTPPAETPPSTTPPAETPPSATPPTETPPPAPPTVPTP